MWITSLAHDGTVSYFVQRFMLLDSSSFLAPATQTVCRPAGTTVSEPRKISNSPRQRAREQMRSSGLADA